MTLAVLVSQLPQYLPSGSDRPKETSMTRKFLLSGGVAVAIASVAAVLWLRSGPDSSEFAYLTAPRLTHLQPQRMLVVEATGDPNVVSGGAIKLLFATYFKANGVSRMQPPPAPRARWPQSLSTPGIEWVGRYALPVGDRVTTVPAVSAPGGLCVSLETWEYGEVAEVVHIGPYNTEENDITRLQTFVTELGFRVIGDHEEEYVRGPGMILAGDPQQYITIIRLRVVPQEEDPDEE
jgi:hypothetical protein